MKIKLFLFVLVAFLVDASAFSYTKSGGDEYVYCNDDKSVSGIAGECQESQCDIQVDNGVVLSSESGGWFWIQVNRD